MWSRTSFSWNLPWKQVGRANLACGYRIVDPSEIRGHYKVHTVLCTHTYYTWGMNILSAFLWGCRSWAVHLKAARLRLYTAGLWQANGTGHLVSLAFPCLVTDLSLVDHCSRRAVPVHMKVSLKGTHGLDPIWRKSSKNRNVWNIIDTFFFSVHSLSPAH